MSVSTDLRYPVGKFSRSETVTPAQRAGCIEELARLPERANAATRALSIDQLDTPYRDGGWTARQVVHHIADSHMNAYIRICLLYTSPSPRDS